MDDKNLNISNYKNYILKLKQTHDFVLYTDVNKTNKNYVLWRHDIDFSINNSVKIAQIENELNISSIFFVHLHNENYNFLDKNVQQKLIEIKNLGHSLELHLCCDYYSLKSIDDLNKALKADSDIFEKHLHSKLTTFSFHNPTKDVLNFDDNEYYGLINAYSKHIKENTVYASDSNGYWRHKSIGETIQENPDRNLQILTHPIWWHEYDISPRNKIVNCINEYAEERINNYDNMLLMQGRINIK